MKFSDVVEGIAHLATTTCVKRDPSRHVRLDFDAQGCERSIVIVRPDDGTEVWAGPDNWELVTKGRSGWETNWTLDFGDVSPSRIRIWDSELHWQQAELREPPALDRTLEVGTDFEWLGEVIDTMVQYHLSSGTQLRSLRYEFLWKNQRRQLEWSVGNDGAMALLGVAFNGTEQTRFRGEGSALADLRKFLGRSWRYGGIRVSPLYPVARPKPYTGWGT